MPPLTPRTQPRAPQRQRLGSIRPTIRGESIGPIDRERPTPRHSVTRLANPKQPERRLFTPTPPPKQSPSNGVLTCTNPNCDASNVIDEDGMQVCTNCGIVISESAIVAEVTFGETSAGAAVVQGTYVGADQTHGRTFGPSHLGGGMPSREITFANGNRAIGQLSRALNIAESNSMPAKNVFRAAVSCNFNKGRRIKAVAAVCLLVACRMDQRNTTMIIDFADVLQMDVYRLGRDFKQLLKDLSVTEHGLKLHTVEPENLIHRFAKGLEFGDDVMRICRDAVRIVARMQRDWLVTGRRVAGICSAALILAARMNNYRRTVREVVYVTKIAEPTIQYRLAEFKQTGSGQMTVSDFRTKDLEDTHNPPAFNRQPGRKRKRKDGDTAAEIEGDDADTVSSTASPAPSRAPRVDADGFAVPDLPIDPALQQNTPPATQSGTAEPAAKKPRKTKAYQPTAEEEREEQALEREISELISHNTELSTAAKTTLEDKERSASTSATTSAAINKAELPGLNKAEHPAYAQASERDDGNLSDLDDDPEVSGNILTPQEAALMERIWVNQNVEYLREQQAKNLKRALREENEDENGTSVKKKDENGPQKRRKGRMGDVSYLKERGSGTADGKAGAANEAEAISLMLEERGMSVKVNYNIMLRSFGPEEANKYRSKAQERARSKREAHKQRRGSNASRRSAVTATTSRAVSEAPSSVAAGTESEAEGSAVASPRDAKAMFNAKAAPRAGSVALTEDYVSDEDLEDPNLALPDVSEILAKAKGITNPSTPAADNTNTATAAQEKGKAPIRATDEADVLGDLGSDEEEEDDDDDDEEEEEEEDIDAAFGTVYEDEEDDDDYDRGYEPRFDPSKFDLGEEEVEEIVD